MAQQGFYTKLISGDLAIATSRKQEVVELCESVGVVSVFKAFFGYPRDTEFMNRSVMVNGPDSL